MGNSLIASSTNAERMSLAVAVTLLDLGRSGVRSELADSPFGWGKPVLKVVPVATAAPVVKVAEVPAAVPVLLEKTAVRQIAQAPVKTPAVAASAEPVRVATRGEPGGVVLVRRSEALVGEEAPALPAAEARLLQNMLLAVGLASEPLGEVVLGGNQDVVQLAAQQPLRDAVARMAPKALLVLGQAAVGSLAGQALGVEGWQAFANAADPASRRQKLLGETEGEAAMTVTYPLELLLARPLFKRLAWQHIQNWSVTAVAGNAHDIAPL